MFDSARDIKQRVKPSSAPKRISKIQFGTLLSHEIQKVAEMRVTCREVYTMPARVPAIGGCIDPRLGISDKVSFCRTCNKRMSDCAGHFGYIQLELPVFHIGYMKHTLNILQAICKKCSRILLPANERVTLLRRLKSPRSDALTKAGTFKKIIDLCKRNLTCNHCGNVNGTVKKIGGTFKLVHDMAKVKFSEEQNFRSGKWLEEILQAHPDLKATSKKVGSTENINPVRAYELMSNITEEDMTLLWMNGEFGRPESLILWTVPVPPVPIRPSVPQDQGGSNEDDITVKLQEIVEMNNALKLALDKGATMKMIAEDWEFLQIQLALLINGETPGIPRQYMGPRTLRGFCQRLKGKQGRFRGNLSGKRVDFSGRTVISPDPNLRVDQVGIPILVAKTMTYPERVNNCNIHKLMRMVLNGPDVHPGASIVRSSTGTISLQYADKAQVAAALKVGDVVDRHMCDDDLVLFNRQPSLHKMSIMCHRVRVMPWRTFRFNECACTPYNADFDGDEMNIHLPQSEEARAEAAELMSVTYNLITPRHGVPLVAATQDFLTGAFLLTQRDVFFNRADFCRLVAYLSDADEHIDLPLPTIFKPRKLWTGKQVITLLVRPNRLVTSFVNLESEEKFYTKKNKHFCEQEGYVEFRNGELIAGNLGKKTLGGESKTGLFYILIRDYGPQEAIRCMTRLAKLCARFITDRGMSIGIDDVTPSVKILQLKKEVLERGMESAIDVIAQYKSGGIKLKPGCNALQSLESELNGILSKVRGECGDKAVDALQHRNSPLLMANCGSKGSPLNISQMIACLGQQSVGGSRIQDGFVGRSLPHFPIGSLTPAAKGFVANSFFSGLTATEFFFHTMGGREGLVDTAVKTAETGYMARRLMKALEDLSMQYDYTVRNSESTVVQFVYGDDGLNPQMMERDDRPVEYGRIMSNVCSLMKCVEEDPLNSSEIRSLIDDELLQDRFQSLLPQGQQFLDETRNFFYSKAQEIAELEQIEADEIQSLAPPAVVAGTSKARSQKAKPSREVKLATVKSIRDRLRIMTATKKRSWVAEANSLESAGSLAHKECHRIMRDNLLRITQSQVKQMLEVALGKYYKAMVEPGEAVGAVGAQSLSEPGTQMTLKTFHFAGVASMNVTLGVPRLKEIINASKIISTPIIEARLLQSESLLAARIVKARIEKSTLGEVAKYIREIHNRDQSFVLIKLDIELIQKFHLEIDGHTVKQAMLRTIVGLSRPPVMRTLKDQHILVDGKYAEIITVLPPEPKLSADKEGKGVPSHQRSLFITQALKNALPLVIVQGVPTVSRAVINVEEGKGKVKSEQAGAKDYHLLVEGYGLRDVMGCPGVDFKHTKTNHIIETQAVLGIEAARTSISAEIKYIVEAYGIAVDRRHLLLLSDVMTFKGEILGITRFGVAKMRESVLMLASFEKTTDHLFDAAVHSREDSIVGVSECIIMGVPIPIGTGLFKLLLKAKAPVNRTQKSRILSSIST